MRGLWRLQSTRRMVCIATSIGMLGAIVSACGGASTAGGAAARTSPVATQPPATAKPVSQPRNGNAPPARVGAAVGFDPITKTLLMFGGAPATGRNVWTGHPAVRLDDTWAWDGGRWTQLHPATSPPPLFGARMVKDPNTGHLLLLAGAGDSSGGAISVLEQEGMWEWDGHTWSHTGDNPVQVPFPAAAADPVRRQVVMSGFDAAYPSACLQCTPLPAIDQGGDYVMTAGVAGWTAAAGQAPGWSRAGTAYDPISQRIITTAGGQQNGVQWTYAWDGASWTRIIRSTAVGSTDPDQPAGPCDAATDDAAGHIVMACAPGAGSTDTWTFNGQAWQRVPAANAPAIPAGPSLPSAAGLLSLAFDPAVHGVVMLLGGASGSETMALWRQSAWVDVAS